jgi:hypothetical protein
MPTRFRGRPMTAASSVEMSCVRLSGVTVPSASASLYVGTQFQPMRTRGAHTEMTHDLHYLFIKRL